MTTTDQLRTDIDLIAGLAAERLADLERVGSTTHRVVRAEAEAAAARIQAYLAEDSHG